MRETAKKGHIVTLYELHCIDVFVPGDIPPEEAVLSALGLGPHETKHRRLERAEGLSKPEPTYEQSCEGEDSPIC